jgi:hypothetical protein
VWNPPKKEGKKFIKHPFKKTDLWLRVPQRTPQEGSSINEFRRTVTPEGRVWHVCLCIL